jgi:hypothetical protein
MHKKIKIIFFLLSLLIFNILIIKYYFSQQNVVLTNKIRSSIAFIEKNANGLPVLENDTDNIIIYKNDLEEFKKKSKKRSWEKLINN